MELLSHQKEAVEKFRNVKARLVGDSMGVGKTATGIGLDLDMRSTYGKPGMHIKTLIICSKNGLEVWERHLLEFGVKASRILCIDPKNRKPFESELANGAHKYDYYICHWDVLTRLEDINRANHIVWTHVIADEAHMAKNRQAARTRELKKLKCHVKTALTGTPVSNKPHDLWSVLNWLYPKHFSSYWRFFNTYVEWNDWTGYRTITGVKNIKKLHEVIEPFYIRRTLYDVRADMPKKSYRTIEVELEPKQRKTYENMKEFQVARLSGHNVTSSVVVALYQRLQKLAAGTCEVEWSEAEWALYYSDLKKYEDLVQAWEDSGREGVKPKRPRGPSLKVGEPSPKIDAVFDLIESEEDEQFVVFSQFSDVVDLIEARCNRRKIPVSKITGSITDKNSRNAAVASFQSGDSRIFVGTIGAAGTTITLNAAHTLIFVDRDWNPSNNEQAEDRIFRIDNDDLPIQIIDIVAKDTVDEYRLARIEEKAGWIREMLEPPS